MTLSTHAVVGASIAVLSKVNPVLAFFLGFGSHFILDSIPHWDYKVTKKNITVDVFFGVILVFVFFYSSSFSFHSLVFSAALWGAFGAVLPDLLIGFHMKFPTKLVSFLHRFHIEIIHSKTRLDHMTYMGPLMQFVFIAITIYLVRYYAVM